MDKFWDNYLYNWKDAKSNIIRLIVWLFIILPSTICTIVSPCIIILYAVCKTFKDRNFKWVSNWKILIKISCIANWAILSLCILFVISAGIWGVIADMTNELLGAVAGIVSSFIIVILLLYIWSIPEIYATHKSQDEQDKQYYTSENIERISIEAVQEEMNKHYYPYGRGRTNKEIGAEYCKYALDYIQAKKVEQALEYTTMALRYDNGNLIYIRFKYTLENFGNDVITDNQKQKSNSQSTSNNIEVNNTNQPNNSNNNDMKIILETCTKKDLLTIDGFDEEKAKRFISERKKGKKYYVLETFAMDYELQPHQMIMLEDKIIFSQKPNSKWGRKVDF